MVSRMRTTAEITAALLERAKKAARRERTPLGSLVEEGLRLTVDRKNRHGAFRLRDASVGGRGLTPEFQAAAWERIRDAAYGGSSA
jgi:hypothetical protein